MLSNFFRRRRRRVDRAQARRAARRISKFMVDVHARKVAKVAKHAGVAPGEVEDAISMIAEGSPYTAAEVLAVAEEYGLDHVSSEIDRRTEGGS